MAERLRVGILFGGRSGEHQVSVVSAASVAAALDPERYEVVPIGITAEGNWLPGVHPRRLLEGGDSQVKAQAGEAGSTGGSALLSAADNQGRLLAGLHERLDVIFPVLHGPYGEDGTVQGLLELADIPYVGAGVLASAVGMDKGLMKAVFRQAGLPVPAYLLFLRKEWETSPSSVERRIGEEIGYPCFVKPANLGSSVGISKVHRAGELAEAMNLACAYDRRLVVEEAISGRELECGVLGNDEPIASVPGEIVPCEEFYSYNAKYVLQDSKLHIPAPVPPGVAARVQDLAVRAFKAVDGSGLARVDFFLRGEEELLVNEINTMPGFTSISMYPKLWEASGVSYRQLVDRLIELALERHADRARSRIL
ncbi:MAG: D-alanine--D-alanine ligase family protein [Patescibacteria group bacterium]